MNPYDPFAHYYDADFADFAEDLLFYREMARRTGGPLLELMCGTGRLLLPLAEDGFVLTGVDSSPAMLALARARLDHAGVAHRVGLVEGDVRDVGLPAGHFALAFVAVNSFMHLETMADQLAALAVARHTLSRKGTLVIDLFNPDPNRIIAEDNRLNLDHSFMLNGHRVDKLVAIDSDFASQLSRVTYFYDEVNANGSIIRRTMRFTMRWLYRYELEHLLARAGFVLRTIYGSYDLDDYTSESPRLIAIASPAR